MNKIFWIVIVFVGFLTGDLSAAPTAIELTPIFDRHNAAVAAGNIDQALDLRTAQVKSEILSSLRTPQEKAGFGQMLKAMTPVSYQVDRLEADEAKATVYLTGTFKDPQATGKEIRQEFKIYFLKETGAWKMAEVIFIGNPAEVKRSSDQGAEPEGNYALDRMTSLGGRIVSVKFEKDHTLVTLRIVDEENLVFLPAKAGLEKSGVRADSLTAGRLLEVRGHPHKTNPLKILGETAKTL